MAVFGFVLLMLSVIVANAMDNNCSQIQNLSSCIEVVIRDHQEVAFLIEVANIESATITTLSEPITVKCTNGGRLMFRNISSVVIKNIQFFSCGDESQSKYGLEFFNVKNVYLSDIVLANSSFGALRISGGGVNISNIVIENNLINNGSNVVILNSAKIHLSGTNKINNNWFHLSNNTQQCSSMATFHFSETKTVLFINNSTIEMFGSLNVKDNFGPSGIIHITNSQKTIQFQGEGAFYHNKVCINGALHLQSTNGSLTGNFIFENNTAHEYYFQNRPSSAASIGLLGSHLDINGWIQFTHNHGDATALYINEMSSVNVVGTIGIANQTDGYTGIFVRGRSKLTINGTGEFLRNRVHNSVMRLESGMLNINGNVTFDSNYGNTPCSFRIRSAVHMTGSIIFYNNSGVFYIVDSSVVVEGEALFASNNIRDFGIGGAVSMFRSQLDLRGHYIFENNAVNDVDGGVVYGQLSTITFQGHGSFIGNSARYGGVIYFQNKPTIMLKEGATLTFSDNTAIKGGVFYIFGSLDSFRCGNQTVKLIDYDTPPCFINTDGDINKYSLTFNNNTAKQGGSVLQVRVVEDFDLVETKSITFSKCDSCAVNLFTKQMEQISKTNSKPVLSSDTFQLCFCNNGKPICSQSTLSINASRGDFFTVEVIIMVFNIFSHYQKHPVRSFFQSSNSEILQPKINNRHLITGDFQFAEEHCTTLNYSVQTTADREMIMISADESCEVTNAQLMMEVSLIKCPHGFSEIDGICECDSRIEKYLRECNIVNKILTKYNNYNDTWMKAYVENGEYKGMLYYQYCPFEYCQTKNSIILNISDSDNQCANNRTGIVCGRCQEGFSRILGQPFCRKCSNSYLALLIPFALLGILLVFFLFVTQLTVATGTIHGLILYANIVNANRDIFFPTKFCPFYTVFISWLNLDFGINSCFYNGMDQLMYTGWQFVFPLYLWFVVGCMIAACRYSVRLSKFFGKIDPVAALATIILLSYNKLLQNVVAIFSVANLNYPPNSTNSVAIVWYLDPNIAYGGHVDHIILCGVAILILVALFLPYTFILIFSPFLQKSSIISSCLRRSRLTPFIKTYHAPYKPRTRFWIGFCLLLRCVVLSTIAGADNATYGLIATSVLCLVLISIIALSRGIYSKKRIDILEVSFITNLGILSIVTYHFQLTGNRSNSVVLAYLSVTIAIVTFCWIITFRVIKRIKVFREASEKMTSKINKPPRKESSSVEMDGSSETSVATSQNLVMMEDNSFQLELREPLLESGGR